MEILVNETFILRYRCVDLINYLSRKDSLFLIKFFIPYSERQITQVTHLEQSFKLVKMEPEPEVIIFAKFEIKQLIIN